MWMQILLRVLLLLGFENHAIFSYCQNVLLDSQNSKSALSDIIKKFWAFLTWLVTACLQRKGRRYFGARAFSLPPQSTRLVCTVKHNWKSCSEITARKTDLPLNPLSSLKLATSLISFIIISKDKCSYDVHKFKHSSQKKLLISHCFVVVLLLNEKLFLATAFEFVHAITALVFCLVRVIAHWGENWKKMCLFFDVHKFKCSSQKKFLI